MTPDEMFQRMQNSLNTLAEHLAHFEEREEAQRIRHDKEMADIRELQNAFAAGMIRLQEGQIRLQEAQAKSDRRLDDSKQEWEAGMKQLREAQRITEEKLHALIETVDQIIRREKRGQ